MNDFASWVRFLLPAVLLLKYAFDLWDWLRMDPQRRQSSLWRGILHSQAVNRQMFLLCAAVWGCLTVALLVHETAVLLGFVSAGTFTWADRLTLILMWVWLLGLAFWFFSPLPGASAIPPSDKPTDAPPIPKRDGRSSQERNRQAQEE